MGTMREGRRRGWGWGGDEKMGGMFGGVGNYSYLCGAVCGGVQPKMGATGTMKEE